MLCSSDCYLLKICNNFVRGKFPEREKFSLMVSRFSAFEIWCEAPAGRAIVDCTRQTELATNLVSMFLSKDLVALKRAVRLEVSQVAVYLELVYLVTALVTACLASSPGCRSLTLDLPGGGDGGPLVVVGELAGLSGDPVEQVVDERVHDAHGLGGDTSVGVDLLQHLVDVQGVGFLPLLFLLLVSRGLLLGLAGLLDCLSADFGCHLVVVVVEWVDDRACV